MFVPTLEHGSQDLSARRWSRTSFKGGDRVEQSTNWNRKFNTWLSASSSLEGKETRFKLQSGRNKVWENVFQAHMWGWSSKDGSSPALRTTGSQQEAKRSWLRATQTSSLSSCSRNTILSPWWWWWWWRDEEASEVKASGRGIHRWSRTRSSRSVLSVAKTYVHSSAPKVAPAASSSFTESLQNKTRKQRFG